MVQKNRNSVVRNKKEKYNDSRLVAHRSYYLIEE